MTNSQANFDQVEKPLASTKRFPANCKSHTLSASWCDSRPARPRAYWYFLACGNKHRHLDSHYDKCSSHQHPAPLMFAAASCCAVCWQCSPGWKIASADRPQPKQDCWPITHPLPSKLFFCQSPVIHSRNMDFPNPRTILMPSHHARKRRANRYFLACCTSFCPSSSLKRRKTSTLLNN